MQERVKTVPRAFETQGTLEDEMEDPSIDQ